MTDKLNVIAIPGLTMPEIPDDQVARIADAAGGHVWVVPDTKAAMAHADSADAILGLVPPSLFNAAPNLRWVHAISSGVDSFMYDEMLASEVILTSEKGLVGEHLADHGFGLLLMLTRQLGRAAAMGADAWNHWPALRRKEIELTGLTMGLIGFGGTGRSMARRAAAFGMHCLAIDRDAVPASPEVAEVWPSDQLPRLLAESDVLAVCCPLTPETRSLLNDETLAGVKPGAFLVNVTRGEVMDEAALVRALTDGRLQGAALDVVPREPLPAESTLWQLDNVVMTPHTAGASQFRAQRNLDRFVDNLGRIRRSEPLVGVIDKALGY